MDLCKYHKRLMGTVNKFWVLILPRNPNPQPCISCGFRILKANVLFPPNFTTLFTEQTAATQKFLSFWKNYESLWKACKSIYALSLNAMAMTNKLIMVIKRQRCARCFNINLCLFLKDATLVGINPCSCTYHILPNGKRKLSL